MKTQQQKIAKKLLLDSVIEFFGPNAYTKYKNKYILILPVMIIANYLDKMYENRILNE